MNRICNKCQEEKPLTAFHKDTKGKDGRAARCAVCKNAAKPPYTNVTYKKPNLKLRTPAFEQKLVSGQQEKKLGHKETMIQEFEGMLQDAGATIVDVTPKGENLFSSLSERFGSTYTIIIHKNGKSTIQIHSSPVATHFVAETPEALLEKIMC